MLNEVSKKEAFLRLKKIEGQIRGIEKMVDEKRYCVDILNQIAAVKRALDGVGMLVMKKHVETCVSSAIKKDEGAGIIDELIQTVSRLVR
jgi:CsoR family transcriptional regulator, copper-sensing transcriptional repressor